ncbi:phosphatase PAP2 family protein [Phenylobacterium sp.]|uniref:phosphatase PAP2 family protein n=1 Tax=Phenylobacterium sp. TaxID=1871053 RepID=UPI002DE501DD|nr:phosphatase PAP2 family protein [Phenylobacterium sp.]
MKQTLIAFAGVAAFVAGLGAANAQPGPAAAEPAAVSKFLSAEALNPAQLLPPPPPDGSPAALAELAELHRIQADRSPQALARARRDDEDESVIAFAEVMGPGFQLDRLPATAALFKDLRAEDSLAAKRAKAFFKRTRPWAADPSIVGCPHGDDAAKSAYPSGHATMAYAAAGALVRLDPPKAQAILARASDYAENRLVCGAHYRRDIGAGQTLGTVLVVKLLETPGFRAEFDAAQAELKAARVVD